jgi:hypothetical protein
MTDGQSANLSWCQAAIWDPWPIYGYILMYQIQPVIVLDELFTAIILNCTPVKYDIFVGFKFNNYGNDLTTYHVLLKEVFLAKSL